MTTKRARVGFGDSLGTAVLDVPQSDGFKVGGVLSGVLTIPRRQLHLVKLQGVGDVRPEPVHRPAGDIFAFAAKIPGFPGSGVSCVIPDLGEESVSIPFAGRHNAFVNQGLQDVLDSAFGDLVSDQITHIGVSADDQAVTAGTTSLDPAGGATGTSIKVTANTARVAQTVHTDQTWTQADVAFAIRKVGLLASSAATDVVNIIGGTGGSAPFNEPLNLDLTSIAAWSLQLGVDCTATAS